MSSTSAASPVRTWFHLCLVVGLAPVLSLPLVWWLAIQGLRRSGEPGARPWHRLLLGLALVDTLVAAVLLLHTSGMPILPEQLGSGPRARIGVELDPDFDGGARVEAVLADSPAASAGLAAGDVIERADGEPVEGPDDLRAALSASWPPQEVTLGLRRGDESLELAVLPEPVPREPRVERGLFEVREEKQPGLRWSRYVDALVSMLPVALALACLWTWCQLRRKRGPLFWWWTLAAMLGALVCSLGVQLTLEIALGGRTSGGLLLGLLAQVIALIALGALAMARRTRAAEPGAGLSAAAGVAIGAGYFLTWIPRVGILTAAAHRLLSEVSASPPMANPVEIFGALGLSPAVLPILLAIIVILGPIGEELVFRGFVLPELRRWMGPAAAVLVTAALFGLMHSHYGVFVTIPFTTGAILGWARVRTGGLAAPIALHALINLIGSAGLWL